MGGGNLLTVAGVTWRTVLFEQLRGEFFEQLVTGGEFFEQLAKWEELVDSRSELAGEKSLLNWPTRLSVGLLFCCS